MKMTKQNFIKLMEKVNLGIKLCRALIILLVISISLNIVLALDILKLRKELDYSLNHQGTMINQKIEQDLSSFNLPPLPETLD